MAAFVENLISRSSVPVLEQLMQFAAARHELITHNIANIDTPGYRTLDLSVSDFQKAMSRAIATRDRTGGRLVLDGEQVKTNSAGRTVFTPSPVDGNNVRFHDQGNRSVEKQMASLAENTLTYNIAAELLRKQFDGLKTAIRQRL